MFDAGLSDAQLFPLLDEAGDALLRRLREHPCAPKYNWRTGERLTASALQRVRDFAAALQSPDPNWLRSFLERCRRTVPYYRSLPGWAADLQELPVLTREKIRRAPWEFVPDDVRAADLITYTTSGTTGTRLQYFATPELPARYLPLLQHALSTAGVVLKGGPNRVSIVHACAQQGTVVLHSVSSYLGGAGFVKINLDPADWNHPDHPAQFLNSLAPELYTGDPFSLWRLSQLPLTHHPKALVSAGAAMSQPLRDRLAGHFRCPVVDLYSMNESGPIGFSLQGDALLTFPHAPHIEILDERNQPCPEGQIGQVVVTGGLNRCLPLIRYATGDYAAMTRGPTGLHLTSLSARSPVIFLDSAGRPFSSLDISTRLTETALAHVAVHQHPDGSVTATLSGDEPDIALAIRSLQSLFGPNRPIHIERLATVADRKRLAFSSDMERSRPDAQVQLRLLVTTMP